MRACNPRQANRAAPDVAFVALIAPFEASSFAPPLGVAFASSASSPSSPESDSSTSSTSDTRASLAAHPGFFSRSSLQSTASSASWNAPANATASSNAEKARVNLFGSGCLHSYPSRVASSRRRHAAAWSSARRVTSLSLSGAARATKHTASAFEGSGLWRYPADATLADFNRGWSRGPRKLDTSSYSSDSRPAKASSAVRQCFPREMGYAPAGIRALP